MLRAASGETPILDDFDAVDAYIAEQEDASGIAEVVAAHFVSSGETTIPDDAIQAIGVFDGLTEAARVVRGDDKT